MSTRSLITVATWAAALLLTLVLAVFQRLTGPTHPLRLSVPDANGAPVKVRLLRSHGGPGGLPVVVPQAAARHAAELEWRRYPTDEAWQRVPLELRDGRWTGEVPHQPPAGKVEYQLVLDHSIAVPAGEAAVARFKGAVPTGVLLPHVLAMFTSMLLFTRLLLGAVRDPAGGSRGLLLAAFVLMVAGGLVLGPVVQLHAFGALWTGWPFGGDLTDNKTAVAVLAWLPAVVLGLQRRPRRWAVIAGWLVMMGVYLVPHSMHGSQIDWSAAPTPLESESPADSIPQHPPP